MAGSYGRRARRLLIHNRPADRGPGREPDVSSTRNRSSARHMMVMANATAGYSADVTTGNSQEEGCYRACGSLLFGFLRRFRLPLLDHSFVLRSAYRRQHLLNAIYSVLIELVPVLLHIREGLLCTLAG